jgi:prefoldin subunit 5
MRHVIRTLVIVAPLLLPAVPASAQATSQEVDSLRRRVEEVERQLFQQRLATPMTPQAQNVERLQMRLEMLERQVASQRISDIAASVSKAPSSETTTTATAGKAPATLDAVMARLDALEKARDEGEQALQKLTARVDALEKAARIRRQQR